MDKFLTKDNIVIVIATIVMIAQTNYFATLTSLQTLRHFLVLPQSLDLYSIFSVGISII